MSTYYSSFFKDLAVRIKAKKMNDLLSQLFLSLTISIAFAAFSGLRDGVSDQYMRVFIPLFLADTIIVLYGCVFEASQYSIPFVILISAGVTLQIFMLPVEGSSLSVIYKYIIIIYIGILMSLLAMPFLSSITSTGSTRKAVRVTTLVFVILMYFVLLAIGNEYAGTKAWVYIGGMSFQITELTKFVSYVFFVNLIADSTISEAEKSVFGLLMLLINTVALAIVNELGTLLVIYITYFIIRFVYTKDAKIAIKEFVILTMIALIALSAVYIIYKMNASGSNSALVNRLALIYPKIVKRFKVFIGSASLTAEDTYQTDMANKGLMIVSWFGTPKGSLSMIPEIDSDFVFIYLIVRLGIVGTVIIFVSLIYMLFQTLISVISSDKQIEGALASTLIISMVVQAMICTASNIGLFPVVGLPFPFLSAGGSFMCINLLSSFYIIFFLRRYENDHQNN